jgi:polyisoprenyl-phosphate glycosyltransferase
MKEKGFISAVVYTRETTTKVMDILSSLDKYLEATFESFEIIVVDDSGNPTYQKDIMKQQSSTLSHGMTFIKLAWQHGPENGLSAGVDLAIGDWVFEIQLDKLNYDFKVLGRLYAEASTGYDIVSATPISKARIEDKIFFSIFNRISYLSFDIIPAHVRIVSRRCINLSLYNNERIIHRGISYQHCGLADKTIIYQPVNGKINIVTTPFSYKIQLATDILMGYTNIGVNISIIISLIFFAIALILGIYAVETYLIQKGVVQGWTTTVLFLSICFSGVFAVLAIQGKYISSILIDIKKRSSYTVKYVDKLPGRDE